jgi:hypothetical protein
MQDHSFQQEIPQTWDEAIAAGLITRAMVEALVAPDPIGWRTSDTVLSPEDTRQRYRDRLSQQNRKPECRPAE